MRPQKLFCLQIPKLKTVAKFHMLHFLIQFHLLENVEHSSSPNITSFKRTFRASFTNLEYLL